MIQKFMKLPTTKKIVGWAICLTTLYIVIAVIAHCVYNRSMPEDITDLVKVIDTGTIIAYMAKSGFENATDTKYRQCGGSEQ